MRVYRKPPSDKPTRGELPSGHTHTLFVQRKSPANTRSRLGRSQRVLRLPAPCLPPRAIRKPETEEGLPELSRSRSRPTARSPPKTSALPTARDRTDSRIGRPIGDPGPSSLFHCVEIYPPTVHLVPFFSDSPTTPFRVHGIMNFRVIIFHA